MNVLPAGNYPDTEKRKQNIMLNRIAQGREKRKADGPTSVCPLILKPETPQQDNPGIHGTN